MKILAIDPGCVYSGWVLMDTDMKIIAQGKELNEALLRRMFDDPLANAEKLAIEMPASYGMAVGETVFNTCRWVGIFQQAFSKDDSYLIYRKGQNKEYGIDSVTMHICNTTRAKDSNVRIALIDLFPSSGKGAIPQIGTKKFPGPLYKIKKDMWAALAVGVTFVDWYNDKGEGIIGEYNEDI